jgi:hypothetical protein
MNLLAPLSLVAPLYAELDKQIGHASSVTYSYLYNSLLKNSGRAKAAL